MVQNMLNPMLIFWYGVTPVWQNAVQFVRGSLQIVVGPLVLW